jgi:hypothetical protein
MDFAVTAVMGTVWRWIFNAIKNALNLEDQAATWIMLILSLLLALAYNMVSGGFAGLDFNLANPLETLEAVTAAWGIIVGTATSWYSLTKDRS